MLALTIGQSLMAFAFCLVCVLLILLILIQKGRGGGLSGAFGGVGSYSPFGTKTGDALTWATVILTGLFLLIAVLANYIYKPQALPGFGATPAAATTTGGVSEGETEGLPSDEGQPVNATPVAPAGAGEATPSVPTPGTAATPAAAPAAPAPPPPPEPSAPQPLGPAAPASQ